MWYILEWRFWMIRLWALLLSLIPSWALARPLPGPQEPPPKEQQVPTKAAASAPPLNVVLLDLEANPAAQDQVAGVEALLLNALVDFPGVKLVRPKEVGLRLGEERQRSLFSEGSTTCAASCLSGLSQALDIRYVIAGRIDRFGKVFVLSTDLLDARSAATLARPHADAAHDTEVPAATHGVAEALLAGMGGLPPVAGIPGIEDVKGGRVGLGLKAGSNFISSLASLSPSVDLELGFRFHPEWNAFLQIGVAFVRAQSTEGALGVNVVPSVVGVRHLYNVEHALQPYWGLGLGVQLSFGDFGPIQRSGLLPTLIGFGGLQFLFTDSVGVLVEIKTDLAQATLGVIRGSSGLGLHLDLSLGVVFHL